MRNHRFRNNGFQNMRQELNRLRQEIRDSNGYKINFTKNPLVREERPPTHLNSTNPGPHTPTSLERAKILGLFSLITFPSTIGYNQISNQAIFYHEINNGIISYRLDTKDFHKKIDFEPNKNLPSFSNNRPNEVTNLYCTDRRRGVAIFRNCRNLSRGFTFHRRAFGKYLQDVMCWRHSVNSYTHCIEINSEFMCLVSYEMKLSMQQAGQQANDEEQQQAQERRRHLIGGLNQFNGLARGRRNSDEGLRAGRGRMDIEGLSDDEDAEDRRAWDQIRPEPEQEEQEEQEVGSASWNLSVWMYSKRMKRVVKRIILEDFSGVNEFYTLLYDVQNFSKSSLSLSIKKPTINHSVCLNLVTGKVNNGGFKPLGTFGDTFDLFNFRKYFFCSKAPNQHKIKKAAEGIKNQLSTKVRFCIPWIYKGEMYYIVVFNDVNGLFVMNSYFEKIWKFLEIFKGDSNYQDSMWKGVYDGVLFFTPVNPLVKVVMYFVRMDDLVKMALDKKGKKKGGLLGMFKI